MLNNIWALTKTNFLGDLFLKNTGNKYQFVTQRSYTDKKGKLPDGIIGTFLILEDLGDYGVDKKTGQQRPTNKGQVFDAYILCGQQYVDLEFGDIVSLDGFDNDNSYAIGFDLILRFKGIKKVTPNQTQQQGGIPVAKKLTPQA